MSDGALMSFNTTKCFTLAINQTSKSPTPDYRLGQELLTTVTSTKYLGVILQSDLKFTDHIESKTTKARQILGMIKRTLYNAPEKAKFLAYTSLCRPILEYAATVWDPQQKNLVHDIEMVQILQCDSYAISKDVKVSQRQLRT